MAHPTRTLLLWLGLLVLLTGALYAWLVFIGAGAPQRVLPQASQARFPADAPAPTPKDAVTAQRGFQYLVQYTSSGFHPSSLTVKKGETVRVTDSAAGQLALAIAGSNVATLSHMQYFEHTFNNAGTFVYSDGTNKMTVTVK